MSRKGGTADHRWAGPCDVGRAGQPTGGPAGAVPLLDVLSQPRLVHDAGPQRLEDALPGGGGVSLEPLLERLAEGVLRAVGSHLDGIEPVALQAEHRAHVLPLVLHRDERLVHIAKIGDVQDV